MLLYDENQSLDNSAFFREWTISEQNCQVIGLSHASNHNHKLLIETGRYNNIPRSDRLCTICGHNVEDETHLLFHCPRYSSLRENFFSKIDHVISNPKQLSISALIVQLMNSTDYYVNMQLVQFISSCFEMRDKLLSIS